MITNIFSFVVAAVMFAVSVAVICAVGMLTTAIFMKLFA